jgi:hypothetical protein
LVNVHFRRILCCTMFSTCEMRTCLHLIGETEITVPRITARQTLRNNVPHTCAEEYYRRSTFLPMIDCIIQEMNDR